MEVRCEKCHKLFRVPDEKISAKGIKFVCTRCGEYVIISREEFEQYQSSNADPIVPGRPPEAESDAIRLQQPQKEKPGPGTPSSHNMPTAATASAHMPEPAQTPNVEPMEVRCGNCKKLFRVPGNKISGAGIKFVCTRCGEYVTVTREEFELYVQAKNDVSTPDATQSKLQPIEQAVPQNEEKQTYKETILTAMPKGQVISFPETSQAAPEKQLSTFPEPAQSREMGHVLETAPAVEPFLRSEPIPVPQFEPRNDFTFETQTEPEQETKPETHVELDPEYRLEPVRAPKPELQIDFTFETQTEPEPEAKPETHVEPAPESRLEPVQAPKPELKIDFTFEPQPEPTSAQVSTPAIQSKTEQRIVTEKMPEPVRTAAPVVRPVEPRKQEPVPENRPSRPLPRPVEKAVQETIFSRFERPAVFVLAAVVFISLAGYGIMSFLKPSWRISRETHEQSVVEGMRITNAAGYIDANGDILIKGTIQNTEGKEKNAWFMIVEMHDKQGTLLNKVRLVSGKQIYTRRDYDVLEKRGVDVRALKEKNLDEQGIIIPPKGTVSFEARYIQPPEEFSSFKALLQPFDPVSRFREISDDTR